MEALVQQARIDLAAFSADEPAAGLTCGDPHHAAELALAGAVAALRYNTDDRAPLVQELRALVDAASLLVNGTRGSASVA